MWLFKCQILLVLRNYIKNSKVNWPVYESNNIKPFVDDLRQQIRQVHLRIRPCVHALPLYCSIRIAFKRSPSTNITGPYRQQQQQQNKQALIN